MAIYYINPHRSVSTATAGTYADPWTLSQTSKSGLASGDEIRIMGVALTSLLTATTYTATYTNNYQLTITAGGGLGADFAANSIVYFPAIDAFAKVTSVAGNILTISGSGSTSMPWNDTSTTSLTVRKVDTTTYPTSVNGTSQISFLTPASVLNNITVSDCWTSATTRVTDGTVKSLIDTNNMGNSTCYFDTSSTATMATGITYNCPNTHIMGGNSNNGNTYWFRASNSTYTFGQLYHGNALQSQCLGIGYTSVPASNTSISIKHYSGYVLFQASAVNGNNISVTIDNLYTYYYDWIFGSGGTAVQYYDGLTVTLGRVVANGTGGSSLVYAVNAQNLTVNLNGIFDLYTNPGLSYIYLGFGTTTINYGASFNFYRNKRTVTTAPTISNIVYFNGNIYGNQCWCPSTSLPTGWTAPTEKWLVGQTTPANTTGMAPYKTPNVFSVSLPDTATNSWYPYGIVDVYKNVLVTHRDGSAPVEVLGIGNNKSGATSLRISCPNVSTDASVYRTTGPSLKSYLANYNAAYWLTGATSIKNIRIPVTSGTSYTVSGYIRTNDTAYTNGDCKMWLVQNGASLASQSITTACINAWSQFTMTFTATQTGEVMLAWEMRFANGAKSIWLDDLTVT